MTSQSEVLKIFQSLVNPVDGIEIKGAKSNYCAVNGNMFCFLSSGGQLALRISSDDREKFLAEHGQQSVCIEHGAVMNGYVLVPDSILQNRRKLNPLFKKCCEFGSSLKPKPTKKKKTTAKKTVAKKAKAKKSSPQKSVQKKAAKKKK